LTGITHDIPCTNCGAPMPMDAVELEAAWITQPPEGLCCDQCTARLYAPRTGHEQQQHDDGDGSHHAP